MADKKITGLTELSTVANADVLVIVDDIAGTPTTKKITRSNLLDGYSTTDTTYTADTPIVLNGTTDTFSIPKATTSVNGYLSSTDWDTFNAAGSDTTYNADAPIILTGTTFSIDKADTTTNGYLSSTDWGTFNSKYESGDDPTFGNITVGTVDGRDIATDGSTLDTHVASTSIHLGTASISHTEIQDIGTNAHSVIDTHLASTSIHLGTASISHTEIQDIGTNAHSVIDTHIASSAIHTPNTDTTYNATTPVDITGTTISISKADTSTNGYLSSADWDTFNGKADSDSDTTYSAEAPVILTGTTFSITQANTTTNGYLSSADWDTFNEKADSDTDTTYNADAPVILTGTTFSIDKADTTTNGYLSSTDWDTFNGKADSDTDTTYSASAPITLTGTAFGMPVANTTTNGYLSSANWDTFNGKADSDTNTTYNVTSPITLTGTTIAITQAATDTNGYLSSADWDTFNGKGDMNDLVDDTSPDLGGELDAGAHSIGFTQQSTTGDGTTTIDWKLGNKFKFTFGAQNDTLTFTAPTNPCNILLVIVQDGTGSRTITWPGTVKWADGTAPTLTTAGNAIDIVSFYYDGTNYFGVASLAFAVPA